MNTNAENSPAAEPAFSPGSEPGATGQTEVVGLEPSKSSRQPCNWLSKANSSRVPSAVCTTSSLKWRALPPSLDGPKARASPGSSLRPSTLTVVPSRLLGGTSAVPEAGRRCRLVPHPRSINAPQAVPRAMREGGPLPTACGALRWPRHTSRGISSLQRPGIGCITSLATAKLLSLTASNVDFTG